jgi:hypothetical protein
VNELVRKELDQTRDPKKAHGASKSEDALIGDLVQEIISQF